MSDQEPSSQHSTLYKALNVIAYPVALTVGLFKGHVSARNSLYDTLKHTKDFKEMRQGVKATEAKDGNVVESEFKWVPGQEGHWGRINTITEAVETVKEELPKEHKRFADETTAFFRKRKFNNTLDYVKGISRSERLNAFESAATWFGAVLGIELAIVNSKSLLNLLSRKDKAETPDDKTPGR